MTADLEAVTRALASYGIDPEDAADIAADLAELPDDRLAEAEAKVQRAEAFCSALEAEDDYVRSWKCARQLRAALSGGDAT